MPISPQLTSRAHHKDRIVDDGFVQCPSPFDSYVEIDAALALTEHDYNDNDVSYMTKRLACRQRDMREKRKC
jgi:hypothetical protein